MDKLKVERLKKLLAELQEVNGEVCTHKECDHFSCPACINACHRPDCEPMFKERDSDGRE